MDVYNPFVYEWLRLQFESKAAPVRDTEAA